MLLPLTPARGQVLVGPGYGYGGSVIGFGKVRGRLGVSFSSGGFYAGPIGYFAPPIRQVTVVYAPPVMYGPGPRSLLNRIAEEVASQRLPPEAPEPPPEPGLAGGAPAGVFRPLVPGDRARAQLPLPPPEEQPKEKPPPQPPPPPKPPDENPPPPKPPAPKPPPEAELPRPPLPEDNPAAENARLIRLGRAAFAAGEYGRAAARFRQAVTAAPREPLAHFLLAQALFAIGKYPESADALHAGLALQPDWPAMDFRPLQLYGGNLADYPLHLARLEAALHNHPDDPTLLFLRGCQLWFDGRRDEAQELFDKARRAGADADDINLFLRALPPAPVL
jgi:hypothetical protein